MSHVSVIATKGYMCPFSLSSSKWPIRSWTFHLAELVAVGLKLLLFSTKTDEYTETGGEVGVDLGNPGTGSGPAVAEEGVDLGNPAEAD